MVMAAGGGLCHISLNIVVALLLLLPDGSSAAELAEDTAAVSFEPRRVQISELPVNISANCRLAQKWELPSGANWVDDEWGAGTTTTTTTVTPTFVTHNVTFDGDYSALVTDKLKLLAECSAAVNPVMCADVKPGSIILTFAGFSDDIEAVASNIARQGLTLPSFGTLRLAASAPATQSTTQAGNSRRLAGGPLPCVVAVYSDSLCHDLVESQENSSAGGGGPRWAKISAHGRLELDVPASTNIACVRLRLGPLVDESQRQISEIRVRQKWDGKWQSDERFAVRWPDLGKLVSFRVHGALLNPAYIAAFAVILVLALGAFHIVCHLKGSDLRPEIPRQAASAPASGTATELPRADAVLTSHADISGKRRSTPSELAAAMVLTVELGLLLLCICTHPFVSVPTLVLTVIALFLPTPCFVVYVFSQAAGGESTAPSSTGVSADQSARRKVEEDMEKRKKDFFERWQKRLDEWHPKTAFTKPYESQTSRYRQSFTASPELCCVSVCIFFGKVLLCLLFIWPSYILHVTWFFISDVFVTGLTLKWTSPAKPRPNKKADYCSFLTGCVVLVLATLFRLLLSPVLYEKIVLGWNQLGPSEFKKAAGMYELILVGSSFVIVTILTIDVALQPVQMLEGEKAISALAIAYSCLMMVRFAMKAGCLPQDSERGLPSGAATLPGTAQSSRRWVSNSWWQTGSSTRAGSQTNPATRPSWRQSLSNAWRGLSPSREEWSFQPGRETIRAITRKSFEVYNDWQEKRDAKKKRKLEEEKAKMATAMGLRVIESE